ncbi:interferon alpha/beta receptor 1-like isoform X2 [Rhinoderma darwinii]|uniref:interferon alpha/beta receptor 1-like isoform X2 n=1 Tax=Rhinoderma darwinii TaxID=43563 RepID=UPI003F6796FE
MREDMAGRLVILLLVTWMVGTAVGTEGLETIDILIIKSIDKFTAILDWNYQCLGEDVKVPFTAVYKKIGAPENESQECVVINCSCNISSDLLDYSHNYTLLVSATTPEGKNLSNSQDFDPNYTSKPPPHVSITSSDGLVMVNILTPDPPNLEEYHLTLRKNDSTEQKFKFSRFRSYIIPPNELLLGQTYCVKVQVYNLKTMELSQFSPEDCFTAPPQELPTNLRTEALDLTYLLKWDWDFDQSPNATFSVEKCYQDVCTKIKGCENITNSQCDCSVLYFGGNYILRASVYDRQREVKSSSVIQFAPYLETVLGPPKDLKMRIENNVLFVDVSKPEVFKNAELDSFCDWLTHLKYWNNSTLNAEEEKFPFFMIESLEASTTYCVKAKMKCPDYNTNSLYSEVNCITTDPRSYLVAWITGFTFLGIVVISVVLYICFCPLKRYVKHVFFPSGKLPSSIDKKVIDRVSSVNRKLSDVLAQFM